MSVLIKGMEMPATCGSCWFCHTVSNEKWHCRLTGKSFESYSVGWGEENNTGDNGQHPYIRRDDCPLVPVPEHGRVIDDVRPVVLCKDCVYWQKPQVWQNDGTFRDYEPGEYERGGIFGGVSLEVGVNYGSFCALYNRNHENQIPQFMGENDFCSKGYKMEES